VTLHFHLRLKTLNLTSHDAANTLSSLHRRSSDLEFSNGFTDETSSRNLNRTWQLNLFSGTEIVSRGYLVPNWMNSISKERVSSFTDFSCRSSCFVVPRNFQSGTIGTSQCHAERRQRRPKRTDPSSWNGPKITAWGYVSQLYNVNKTKSATHLLHPLVP